MIQALLALEIGPVHAADQVIIQDNFSSYVTSSGYLHIVGEVENQGDTYVEYVRVTAMYYDMNDSIVGTNYTVTKLRVLPPHTKSPFELIVDDADRAARISRYSLLITGYIQESQLLPHILRMISNSSFISAAGYLNIIGEVNNEGASKCSYVTVTVTCYDLSGKVVAVNDAYTTPLHIMPKANGTFNMMIADRDQSSKVSRYTLQVESNEAFQIPEFSGIYIVAATCILVTLIVKSARFSHARPDTPALG